MVLSCSGSQHLGELERDETNNLPVLEHLGGSLDKVARDASSVELAELGGRAEAVEGVTHLVLQM
jgi:hypothetical protein